jgi:magnesium-protoporphyrin O-methyltransferase
MGRCCEPPGYRDLFSQRFSHRLARRYRTRGLDRTARRMVAFLAAQGIRGATVLEVGGGVGDIQLELLRQGAARTTNLELVDSYDADAAALAAEAGMSERMTRRRLDLAAEPDAVDRHDIVVLHRVVCCYPDYQRLLAAAAGRTERLLVFSHPPRNPVTRSLFAGQNLFFRLRRSAFRTYVHDPAAMTTAAEQGRLRPAFAHRGLAWHVVGLSATAD